MTEDQKIIIPDDIRAKIREMFGGAMTEDNLQEALRQTTDLETAKTTAQAAEDIVVRLTELGNAKLIGIVLFELVGRHVAAFPMQARKAVLELHATCAWTHMIALEEQKQQLEAEKAIVPQQ